MLGVTSAVDYQHSPNPYSQTVGAQKQVHASMQVTPPMLSMQSMPSMQSAYGSTFASPYGSSFGSPAVLDYKQGVVFGEAAPSGPTLDAQTSTASATVMPFDHGSEVRMQMLPGATSAEPAPVSAPWKAMAAPADAAKQLAARFVSSKPAVQAVPESVSGSAADGSAATAAAPSAVGAEARLAQVENRVGELHDGLVHHTAVLKQQQGVLKTQTKRLASAEKELQLHDEGLRNHKEALLQTKQKVNQYAVDLGSNAKKVSAMHQGLLEHKKAMETLGSGFTALHTKLEKQYKVDVGKEMRQHNTFITKSKPPSATPNVKGKMPVKAASVVAAAPVVQAAPPAVSGKKNLKKKPERFVTQKELESLLGSMKQLQE